MLVVANNPQELKLELIQSLMEMQEKIMFRTEIWYFWTKATQIWPHLGVSRNKAVHVVVDLLQHEASVHEGEAALRTFSTRYPHD